MTPKNHPPKPGGENSLIAIHRLFFARSPTAPYFS